MKEEYVIQKEFLMGMVEILNNVHNQQLKIIEAIEIGGVINEQAAFDFIKALSSFQMAGFAIILKTSMAYGDNGNIIASDYLNRTEGVNN